MQKGYCNCYRGIFLHSVVDKAFARAILGKLHKLAAVFTLRHNVTRKIL